MKLKRCPCGQLPERLSVVDATSSKWAYATPSCCNEWLFEFRTQYERDPNKISELAEQAWNAMPRAKELEDYARGRC